MIGLTLIYPAYQDEANIDRVVRKALRVLPDMAERFEILVVDDGSLDRTAACVQALADVDPRVRLIRHTRNRGYGQAIRTGLAAPSEMEWICLSDGDGQYDVADLAHMIPLTSSHDVITGARRVNRNPLHRRWMSSAFNALIRTVFRVGFRDLTASLKLIRRDICPTERLLSRGNFTDVEIVLRAHRSGHRVLEVPIEHLPRAHGRSHAMSLKRILETFVELGKVRRSL